MIYIPDNFRNEREYAVRSLFQDFINVPVQVLFESRTDYKVEAGDHYIFFEDVFFEENAEFESYLKFQNIPETLTFQSAGGKELPLIWGTGTYESDGKDIHIGNDLFAAVFFFLSQWEEFVMKRDKGLDAFHKLDESELFIVRNGLQKRCLVNEIADFVKELLSRCGVSPIAENKFSVMLTHDVDRCYLSSYSELCDNIYKMLLAGDNDRARRILGDYLFYRQEATDPFDSFDELMDISESFGLRSHFYFKPCVEGDKGSTYSIYDERVVEIIKRILRRGHYVGLHSTENASLSQDVLKTELVRIKEVTGNALEYGCRTHGLFYDFTLFENMDEAGLEYDSSIGFQYYNGFRSSVCLPYHIFDILNGKTLRLKQIPFMTMDSVSMRNGMSPDAFLQDIKNVSETVRRHSGVFVMNWHSNLFNANGRGEFKNVYKNILASLYR